MRRLEWFITVDPMTFLPLGVLYIDGEATDVQYTLEVMEDLKAQYGEAFEYIFNVKILLDEEMKRKTNLTEEERNFAIGEGFKPSYSLKDKKASGLHWHENLQVLTEKENSAKRNKFSGG